MTDLELRALTSSSVQSAGDRCRLAIGKCTAAPVSVRGKPDYRKRRALDAVRDAPMNVLFIVFAVFCAWLVLWLVYAVLQLRFDVDDLRDDVRELSVLLRLVCERDGIDADDVTRQSS